MSQPNHHLTAKSGREEYPQTTISALPTNSRVYRTGTLVPYPWTLVTATVTRDRAQISI